MEKHKYWKTRDGRNLLITEMETDHIQKTISLIERSYPNGMAQFVNGYNELVDELNIRKEKSLKILNEIIQPDPIENFNEDNIDF